MGGKPRHFPVLSVGGKVMSDRTKLLWILASTVEVGMSAVADLSKIQPKTKAETKALLSLIHATASVSLDGAKSLVGELQAETEQAEGGKE